MKINNIFMRVAFLVALAIVSTTAWADNVTVTSTTTAWTNGNTYNVTSDVTIDTRISVTGSVTLNLGAGATLTASQGIEVSQGNTLTIEGSGTLNATGAEINHSNWTKKYRSGIGADAVGTIIINGGTINATGSSWAAGIGGDSYNSSGGSITINGGCVTATGKGGGAGIGGGFNGAAAGTIVINGGQVTAIAQADGAAIGSGGSGATGGSLTLGWTNVHTDFIEAKRGYNSAYPFGGLSSISFAEGKLFLLDGTATQATVENINQVGTDVKIVPTMEIVDLSNATISGVDTHYEYTGNDIAITPTVTLLSGTLTETDDYTVSYKRNGTEATTVNEAGTYTLTVTGTGFYTGSTNVTFYVNGPANYQAYENGALADKALAYDGYTRVSAATTAMTAGWYVVAEDVTIADRITTSGDVNLVLCNGATLRVQKGIGVTDGNSLTIYGQDGNTGKIVASIPDDQEHHYHAAIGGDRYSPGTSTGTPVKAGSITIHGGEINATSYYKSAGIGKAYEGSAGLITIYGGKVTATCTVDGIGIGGSGATITLGYSNADDFIQSKSYDGAVTIMSGRIFVTNDTPAVNVSSNVSDNATINNKKLTPKTYTVSFNLNGADGSIASQTTYHGLTKAVEPEAPTRTGYTLGGWQLSGSAYDFSTAVTSDIELTAHWRKYLDNTDITVTIPSQTYTGSALTPAVNVKDANGGSEKTLVEDTDYTVTLPDGRINAGNYTVTITAKAESEDYIGSTIAVFAIAPKAVTVTADNKTKTYGETDPTLTYTADGLIGSDALTGALSRAEGENVGDYAINIGTLANSNYTLTLASNGAKLTINPASVTLTANSRNTDVYDGTEKTVIGFTSSVNGLTFTGVSASGSGTNAGEYDVIFSGVTLNETKDATGNYIITATTNGKLTVNPASVTLTANSDTKEYSGTQQTVEGFTSSVDGLAFTGVSASGSGTNTGTYDVTFSGVTISETKDNTGNYVVTETTNGTLTITAATVGTYGALTITEDQNGKTAKFDGTSTETINVTSAVSVKSVIYERTFNVGKASTVMLPFEYKITGNEGGEFYAFVDVKKEGENWVATMKPDNNPLDNTQTLTANKPYLFLPTAAHITFTIPNEGVSICTDGGGNCQTADVGSHWTFKGMYSYKQWAANDTEIGKAYGFAGIEKTGVNVGDFVKIAAGAKIRPMSCYLLWSDTPNNARALTRGVAATDELPQSITVRLVGSSGETTSIGTLDTKTGELSFDGWYTLDGVRLSGKPSKPGLYINNGKKIVIK